MAEYLVRKGKIHYEMAKFEDSDSPVAVYIFTPRGCSCPSYSKSCKHNAILRQWKKDGEIPGSVYDDSAKLVTLLHVQ